MSAAVNIRCTQRVLNGVVVVDIESLDLRTILMPWNCLPGEDVWIFLDGLRDRDYQPKSRRLVRYISSRDIWRNTISWLVTDRRNPGRVVSRYVDTPGQVVSFLHAEGVDIFRRHGHVESVSLRATVPIRSMKVSLNPALLNFECQF